LAQECALCLHWPAMSGEALLEPAEVRLVFPDGEEEVREALLDLETGKLVLRQVAEHGSATSLTLASLGTITAVQRTVKLRAPGQGRILLELRFGSATLAQQWSKALRYGASMQQLAPASPQPSPSHAVGGPARPSPRASASAQTAATLRLLVEQQEEQLGLLQALHERKAEQVVRAQQRLAGVLDKLTDGQAVYAEHQHLLDKQRGEITALHARLQARAASGGPAPPRAAATSSPAAASGSGRPRPWGARLASSVLEEDEDTSDAQVFSIGTPAAEAAPGSLGGAGLSERRPARETEIRQSLRELHTVMQVLGLGESLSSESRGDSP